MVTTTRSDPEVVFRSQIGGEPQSGETDTTIAVTEDGVHAQPTADGEGRLDFTLGYDEITGVECNGVVNRSITIETDNESYEVPTTTLDERGFRQAIVEHSDLSNPYKRLSFGPLGVCLCPAGSSLGCLLIVAGIGLVLSLFGALLGIGFIVAGAALLVLAYLSRKITAIRGSNRWERANGSEQSTV